MWKKTDGTTIYILPRRFELHWDFSKNWILLVTSWSLNYFYLFFKVFKHVSLQKLEKYQRSSDLLGNITCTGEKYSFCILLNSLSSFTSSLCCSLPSTRSAEIWDIYERAISGETPIPGSNLTAGDVGESFDRITAGIDEISEPIVFMPTQQNALSECIESGLCA